MRFWDASAIVPLLVRDVVTPVMTSLLQDDPEIVAWWGTPVECVSALARRQRESRLTQQALVQAVSRLHVLQEVWNEVEPAEIVRETAERLLRVHPLRAADSLQLAAALVLTGHRPSQLPFVCRDERLSDAAEREGFTVLPR
jgi:predicted nucleic acid-binding protein